MGSYIGLCMDECDTCVQRTGNLRRENTSLRTERSGLAQPDHGNVNGKKEQDTVATFLLLPLEALSGTRAFDQVHLVKEDPAAHPVCLSPVCPL